MTTVPLTAGQKMLLALQSLPAVLLFCGTILSFLVLSHFGLAAVSLAAVPAALTVLEGRRALACLRDLAWGRAVVEEDVLNRTWDSSRVAFARHAEFERLGNCRLTGQAYSQSLAGTRHRVVYSPATAIVWSAESIDSFAEVLEAQLPRSR